MQQTKKFKMADAISPYLAVSCGLIIQMLVSYKYGMNSVISHDDVIKWKHFLRNWPFDQWIPRTKASDTELWCILWSAPEQTVEWTIETLVIWEKIVLIMLL